MSTLRNILTNAKDPAIARELVGKVRNRLETDRRKEATSWAREHAISVEGWCRSFDPEIWHEVSKACDDLTKDAYRRLDLIDSTMGGGGAYSLLMFLTRIHKPKVVFETGVAAGWSSRAILEALLRNGNGVLYSSDFPYFRQQNPEQHIGLLVPDELRAKWTLDIRGDRVALPRFVSSIDKIDMFHFDSDKSYRGRKFAVDCITPKLARDAVVIMDDIQDNLFFHDYAARLDTVPTIFEFGGKFVGVIGLPEGL